MSAAWSAATALVLLVVVSGRDSGARLRAPSAVSLAPPAWNRARSARASGAAAAVDVPASLALELRSGRDLAAALSAAAEEFLDRSLLAARLRAAAAAARAGEPVQPVLAASPDPLGRALLVTAVCCDLATSAGLPLADLLDAVVEEARGRSVLLGRAKAELAGARSTSVVLACLPVVGLAMGQLLGARPVHVLLDTGWGAGCLLGALVLTGAGSAWSRAIRRSAERSLS